MGDEVIVVGGGLAGSEAAWKLAQSGFKVTLNEMRPLKYSPAHSTDKLGELVCSNSLKSMDVCSCSGLLKKELEICGSLLINTAYECAVPAGGALVVDRNKFSSKITETLSNHKSITINHREITSIPETPTIIATGPLTSDTFAEVIKEYSGGGLYFVDALSPIIAADSIDFSSGYFLDRYGKGDGDYFNIPLTKELYDQFYDELMAAEKTRFHEFEKLTYFEGCMPIEAMAERGRETLTFGPMKPVGLENPETGVRPYAVIQLRKENAEGTAFNMVGFQTKMTNKSQKRVFSALPALKNVEFLRFGAAHINTYIDAPSNLNKYFQFQRSARLFMAGQITGLEGYCESIAGGLIAAIQMSRYLKGESFVEFPRTTALGSISSFICGGSGLAHAAAGDYSPSNFHFGMLEPLTKKIRDKKLKKETLVNRALSDIRKVAGSI